jgi:TssR protein N-terminal barrel domain
MTRNILITGFLFVVVFAYGQQPNVMSLPQKYLLPEEKLKLSVSKEKITGKPWEVFSDRMYNVSYDKPQGDMRTTLTYMDMFYVIGENKEYLQIVTDRGFRIGGGISDSSVYCGWIEKENMLLWKHCLLKEDYESNRKAILINKLLNPYFINKSAEECNNKLNISFFYVYKEDKERKLLGKIPRISGNPENISEFMLGWYPSELLIEWDNNLALKPNNAPEAVVEREKIQIPARVFDENAAARKYKKGKSIAPIDVTWNEGSDTADAGRAIIFPVIDIRNDIAEVIMDKGKTVNNSSNVELRGYCSPRSRKLTSNMFNYVVLLKRTDLTILLDYLERVGKAVKDNEFRNNIENLVFEFMPSKINDREDFMADFTLNELNRYLFNAYNPESEFGDLLMVKYRKKKKLSDDVLQLFDERIQHKIVELNRIIGQNNSEYSFYHVGIMYYLLPAVFLP